MPLSTELGNLFSKEGVSENEKRQEFLERAMETVNAPDEDSSPINYLPSSNFSRLTPRQREEERKEQQATTTYKTPKLPIGPAILQASSTKGRRRVVDFAEVPNFGDDGKFSGVRKVPVGVSSKGKKVSVKDIPLLSGQTGVGSLNIKGFGTLEDKKTKIDLEGNIKKRVSAQARELGFKGSLGDLEFDYSNLKEGKKGNKKETTHSTNLGYTLNQGDKGKFNVSVGAAIPTGSGQEPTYKGRFGYTKTFREGGIVDMRDGGKVGAAMVAASLMASGGQAMDMRDGGVVGMVHGGPVHGGQASAFSPSKEFIEYIKSVENSGRKGYNKDTKLWYAYPPTGNVGNDMEEISYGIVRPKGGSPLTQEESEKLLGKRMQDAFKVAERVVDKRMKSGTFNSLPQRKKEVFVDYAFNMSEEAFTKYKNFIPALVNDNKKGVEEEYIRNMRDKNNNLIPLGRNKHFKKFFTEFFPEKERSKSSYSFSYFPKQTKL